MVADDPDPAGPLSQPEAVVLAKVERPGRFQALRYRPHVEMERPRRVQLSRAGRRRWRNRGSRRRLWRRLGGGFAEGAAGQEEGGEERERDRLHLRRMLAAWHPEGKPARRIVNMPQSAWSPQRERPFVYIKEGLRARGTSVDKAEEIPARTVSKERARQG